MVGLRLLQSFWPKKFLSMRARMPSQNLLEFHFRDVFFRSVSASPDVFWKMRQLVQEAVAALVADYVSGTIIAGFAGSRCAPFGRRQAPDAWHHGRSGPVVQLWWVCFACDDTTRDVFSLIVDWPRMLGMLIGMHKKESNVVQRTLLRFWWFCVTCCRAGLPESFSGFHVAHCS